MYQSYYSPIGPPHLHIEIPEVEKPVGFSQVYQCLRCRCYYGKDSRLPQLTPTPEVTGRYSDCSTWRCPRETCKSIQDSRDLQPFLGCGGGNNLRLLKEEDIKYELILRIVPGF